MFLIVTNFRDILSRFTTFNRFWKSRCVCLSDFLFSKIALCINAIRRGLEGLLTLVDTQKPLKFIIIHEINTFEGRKTKLQISSLKNLILANRAYGLSVNVWCAMSKTVTETTFVTSNRLTPTIFQFLYWSRITSRSKIKNFSWSTQYTYINK